AVLLGFQAAVFGVLANAFAVMQGLIPKSEFVRRAYRVARLEWGIAVGGALMVIGLMGSIAAVWMGKEHSFGSLNPRHTLRMAIPSVLCLLLGAQAVLASFFLDVMRLNVRARAM